MLFLVKDSPAYRLAELYKNLGGSLKEPENETLGRFLLKIVIFLPFRAILTIFSAFFTKKVRIPLFFVVFLVFLAIFLVIILTILAVFGENIEYFAVNSALNLIPNSAISPAVSLLLRYSGAMGVL